MLYSLKAILIFWTAVGNWLTRGKNLNKWKFSLDLRTLDIIVFCYITEYVIIVFTVKKIFEISLCFFLLFPVTGDSWREECTRVQIASACFSFFLFLELSLLTANRNRWPDQLGQRYLQVRKNWEDISIMLVIITPTVGKRGNHRLTCDCLFDIVRFDN